MVTSLHEKKDNNNKIFRPVFSALISKIKDKVGTVMYWEKTRRIKKNPHREPIGNHIFKKLISYS